MTSEISLLQTCDLTLLPGVGAFPNAIKNLRKRGLDEYLAEEAINDRPILGICLGMQLLATCSYEGKQTKGLGLIPGEILPLHDNKYHIGWNNIKIKKEGANKIILDENIEYFFNHGFYFSGSDENICATTTDNFTFAAIIKRKKILGVQFHPEKSQKAGKLFLIEAIKSLVYA